MNIYIFKRKYNRNPLVEDFTHKVMSMCHPIHKHKDSVPRLMIKYLNVFVPNDWITQILLMNHRTSNEKLFDIFMDRIPMTKDLTYWDEKFANLVCVLHEGRFEYDWVVDMRKPFYLLCDDEDTCAIYVYKNRTGVGKHIGVRDFLVWNGVHPVHVTKFICDINRRLKADKGTDDLFLTKWMETKWSII